MSCEALISVFERRIAYLDTMVSYKHKGEIPSSLDLLPLGERFGDKNKARQRARPSTKFSHIKSSIDHGQIKKRLSQLEVKD